jgi:CheY-like chemotaxis protein
MRKTKNYLIVDDDHDDQQFLIEALKEIDPSCQCFTTSNGEEAIAHLGDMINPFPDVIFLDLNMPLMGGVECLSIVKRKSSLQHIPVIIYSTSSNQKEMQRVIEKGASYFLVKKNSFKELYEELTLIPLLGKSV